MADASDVKANWFWGDPDLPQLGHLVTMKQPRKAPCNGQCPWLADNQDQVRRLYYDHEVDGIPMDDEEFDFSGARRSVLWEAELRDGVTGYASLCHVRLAGTEKRPDDTWHIVGRQCTGALVMQQRELMRYLVDGKSAVSDDGAASIASAALGTAVKRDDLSTLSRRELREALHPALGDGAIGCSSVASPVEPAEMQRWRDWFDASDT